MMGVHGGGRSGGAAAAAASSSAVSAKSDAADLSYGPKVVVVGSCMIDLVFYVDRMPQLGETMHCTSFKQGFGGKGANQAYQAALLFDSHGDVAMVGAVGDDAFGEATRDNMEDVGINVSCLALTPNHATGMAEINVDANGNNAIVIAANANTTITPDAVAAAAHSLFASARVVVTQLEIPLAATLEAMRHGRDAGALVVFNPAPAIADLPDEIFELADFVTPNESETSLMTGGMPVETLDEAEAAGRVLLDRGASNVILTLGARGAMWLSAGTGDAVVIPIPDPVPASAVVDTTGAGDSFVGAFAYYMAQTDCPGIEHAIRSAHRLSAASVQAAGTQTSYVSAVAVDPDHFH
ncbi:ribokinase [Thecamonas trahens ATCC 50062]|uniref:Ribokinase n=1 Tax=Thecamonas trahens ATCC 50062 TaxID=461836 RepID=A0A0L0DDU6_THETB|nr:ribokinase [Thecamonas trahens ATCC 50062]KNC50507.1 ribokinase [Thecamonas trahens ATCC 50062]|eukprot:XP_013762399.1 ribokinase [Thecamonas trahens ATCC 50062]